MSYIAKLLYAVCGGFSMCTYRCMYTKSAPIHCVFPTSASAAAGLAALIGRASRRVC